LPRPCSNHPEEVLSSLKEVAVDKDETHGIKNPMSVYLQNSHIEKTQYFNRKNLTISP
jgi:hypothetical protein